MYYVGFLRGNAPTEYPGIIHPPVNVLPCGIFPVEPLNDLGNVPGHWEVQAEHRGSPGGVHHICGEAVTESLVDYLKQTCILIPYTEHRYIIM